ncbi:TolC family protein [Rhodopirellula sp. JC639]|uniref:TolC family protein n=1 Tax=Stieleria mannarensis TaxID=2755585 RepID=UPI0015FF6F35|nr:TolC family protein [Rhodopirellula sp. JC639]
MPRLGFGPLTLVALVMVLTMTAARGLYAQDPPETRRLGIAQPSPSATIAATPPVGSLPKRLPPAPNAPLNAALVTGESAPIQWWTDRVTQQVLDRDRWVRFDLETILLDTLAHSPRILSVGYEASTTFQRIIQQDAAFDSTILLGGNLGATNDPVGNTLTTGGADRLREKSLNFNGGVRKTTRTGTELELSQEIGFLDSNSSFFVPRDQGNARLSLSLTKPLLSRGGRYYNERLVTQARIESRVAWQDMRGAVEQRIADVIAAYWKLYEARAMLTQQRELLARSRHIERLLVSRKDFDAALIEITKAKQRVARRADQVIDLEAGLKKQQARLAALVGSEAMIGADSDLELIPMAAPVIDQTRWTLRDAVAQALENRPEVRAATHDVELSALELRVARAELEPQLNWVFNGYLAQLNGASKVARSFGEQFANAPGVSTGLEFELPRGRRAFRAQHREALLRARQRSQRLREVIQQTQFDVETALIDLERFEQQLVSKRNVLSTAVTEENILTVQWRIIGGDDSRVGIKLENLLDAQQRRTDAEKDLVKVQAAYMIALVQLQRAMGTLLINEGIRPAQSTCSGEIDFLRDDFRSETIILSPEHAAAPGGETTPDAAAIRDDVPAALGNDAAGKAASLMPSAEPTAAIHQGSAAPVQETRDDTPVPAGIPDASGATESTRPTVALPRRIGRPALNPPATPAVQPTQLAARQSTPSTTSQPIPALPAATRQSASPADRRTPSHGGTETPASALIPRIPSSPALHQDRASWRTPSGGWTR